MSRKNKYIEELTIEQKSSLEKGYKTGKSHIFRRKCQGILKSHEGQKAAELSALFDVTTRTIYQWFNDWELHGIEGLKLKPGRGRPVILSPTNKAHVNTVKTLIKNTPKSSKKVVEQVEDLLELKLSKKTLKRFLKNLNINGNAFENA